MDNFLNCELCKIKYDENERLPLTLLCSHTICRICLENLKKVKINNCPKCQQDVKIVSKKLSQFIPNKMILDSLKKLKQKKDRADSSSEYFSSSNSGMYSSRSEGDEEEEEKEEEDDNESKSKSMFSEKSQADSCIRHKDKFIEFFCQTCTQAVCVNCIFYTHNGHTLTNLSEMSSIIRQNIFDFTKLLTKLQKINEENNQIAQTKIEECKQMKEVQRDIISKTFGEIFYSLEDKKNNLLKEFDRKYSYDDKKFAKLKSLLTNSLNETQKIKEVSEQLEVFVKSHSDATLLKKVDEFTMFLHKSYMDIKRLYKTEISLKAELRVDPNMNPIPINTKNIISIIKAIDPKVVCYSAEINEKNEEVNKTQESIVDRIKKIKVNQPPEKNVATPKRRILSENSQSNTVMMPKIRILSEEDYYNAEQPPVIKITKESGNSITKGEKDNLGFKGNHSNSKYLTLKDNIRSRSRGNSYSSQYNNSVKENQTSVKNSNNNVNNISSISIDTSIYKEKAEETENKNFLNNKSQKILKNTFKEFSQDCKGTFISANEEASTNFSKSTKIKTKLDTTLPIINKSSKVLIESVEIKKQSESPYILCIGDTNYILKYNIEQNNWVSINTDNKTLSKNSSNDKLRYSSLVSIGKSRFIMTGGCYVSNDEASFNCYEAKLTDNAVKDTSLNISTKSLKRMNRTRYAHSSIYINGDVYVCGGFDHKDDQMESPSTLKSCEKYSIADNKWKDIASMNTARGFFGVCLVNKENIFAFGGFSDEILLNSIEKYDMVSDTWISYFLKLPEKLAKLYVINKNETSILILGGINSDFEIVNKVLELDLRMNKFENGKEMLFARSFNQSAFLYDNNVYVIGNNPECNSERFDMLKAEWKLTESYTTKIKAKRMNELYNFCFALNYDE